MKKEYNPNREIVIHYLEISEKNAVEMLLEQYKKEKNTMYRENDRLALINFIFWLYRHRGFKITSFNIHEDKYSHMVASKAKKY